MIGKLKILFRSQANRIQVYKILQIIFCRPLADIARVALPQSHHEIENNPPNSIKDHTVVKKK
jgi:hypothetical protein